jgi:dTDP-4-amino-4,6-dideoxygalactose transaminase
LNYVDKIGINDLAIFGGSPTFKDKLHVGRPNIGNKDQFMSRMNHIFENRWLTNNGQYVQELEHKLAQMLQVRHCIAMCNATIALEITIRALGLTGEVIVPSFTFVATPHSLQWQEITPVFCDIDPGTHNIDPACVKKMITPRTTGIIGVHIWGRPCNIDALTQIADAHNLKLMFDAAHAFGCSSGNRMIGGFGNAEVFSFHATKFFNTFEGGAVTTNDDVLANKINLMKNFGFAGYDNVIYIGTNGKMSEASAAMGLTGLESLDEFIDVNRYNYESYRDELSNIPGFSVVQFDSNKKNNYQYIVCELDEIKTGISRDTLLRILHAENIVARRYFYPGCHLMEPYRSYFPHAGLMLPNTNTLVKRILCLPNGTAVNNTDIKKICQIIKFSVSHGSDIVERIKVL